MPPNSVSVSTDSLKTQDWKIDSFNSPVIEVAPPLSTKRQDLKVSQEELPLAIGHLSELALGADAEDLADGLATRLLYERDGSQGLTRYEEFRKRRAAERT